MIPMYFILAPISPNDIMFFMNFFSNPFDAHVLNTASALPGMKRWFPHMGLYNPCCKICPIIPDLLYYMVSVVGTVELKGGGSGMF